RAFRVLFFAHDAEVDFVATAEIVGGVRAIDERIDRVTQVGGGQLQVGGLVKLGDDMNFGIGQIEAGLGKDLCTGQQNAEFAHDADVWSAIGTFAIGISDS